MQNWSVLLNGLHTYNSFSTGNTDVLYLIHTHLHSGLMALMLVCIYQENCDHKCPCNYYTLLHTVSKEFFPGVPNH